MTKRVPLSVRGDASQGNRPAGWSWLRFDALINHVRLSFLPPSWVCLKVEGRKENRVRFRIKVDRSFITLDRLVGSSTPSVSGSRLFSGEENLFWHSIVVFIPPPTSFPRSLRTKCPTLRVTTLAFSSVEKGFFALVVRR